jgi:hypothetical protein
LSIVGTGLRYIEDVSGRLTTARSAAIFTHAADFFGVVLYGLVAGSFWGVTWGALLHYSQRGRRNFGSVAQTVADRYETQADDEVADEAVSLLEGKGHARV